MLKKITQLCIAAAMLFSATSHAAFVTTDWKTAGDAKSTLDTTTGIEWLDLNQTGGWTMQSVINATNTGGVLAGWRLPTKSEVTSMMNQWFNQTWSGFGIQHYSGWSSALIDFYNTLSFTRASGDLSNGHRWAMGAYLDGSTVLGAGVYHRNSWGSHSGQAWVNDVTPHKLNTVLEGMGVFLVSDGGLTLSSINNPSLNINNPNAPISQPPGGAVSLAELIVGSNYATVTLDYVASGVSGMLGYKYRINGGAEQTSANNVISLTGLSSSTDYVLEYAAYNNNGIGDWTSTSLKTTAVSSETPLIGLLGGVMLLALRRRQVK